MLENRVTDIPHMVTTAHTDLEGLAEARADAERGLAKPFAHATALDDARNDLHRIDEQLAALATEDTSMPEPETVHTLAERAEQLLAKTRESLATLEADHDPTRTTSYETQATLAPQPRGPRLG